MLLSGTTRGDTVYVVMGYIGLYMLPTIYSNTGASYESDEWRLVYPLEELDGAVWF